MMKRKLFLVLIVCLLGTFVSSAFAASTFKRVNVNPFYQPPLTSEADLKALVKSRNTLIKSGFTKAGQSYLYRPFSEQFPSAVIDTIKVYPGENFKWMFFRKKGTGPVVVTKDITWAGATPLEAYRFYINRKGMRYEFAVLSACGNFALKSVTKTPSAKSPAASGKAAAAAPSPVPLVSDKAVTRPAAPMPVTAEKAAIAPEVTVPGAPEKAVVAAPPPMPLVSDKTETGSVLPTPGSPEKAPDVFPAPIPSAPERAATPAPAAQTPGKADTGTSAPAMTKSTSELLRGTVVDVGFSYQFDPASYLFVRMGYEFPLFDKLSLMVFLGGYFRIHGYDGGSAVIADAILGYHWWNRLSFGLGAGYWRSGNDGRMDLIANMGFLLYGKRDSFNSTLFLEARSEVDELGNLNDQGRLGLGLRFRF